MSSSSAKSGERAAKVKRLRHDCRSALHQILGYSELGVEIAKNESSEELNEILRNLGEVGNRMADLVEQLSDIAAEDRTSEPSETAGKNAGRRESLSPPPAAEPHYTLLVVDDNEMNRDILARRLRRRGYDVENASGGEEALELVEYHEFDLILLDVMMPDIDGLEVLRRLRIKYDSAQLPVIMSTARTESRDIVHALEEGANDYVTKPLDFAVVLARVEAQLSLKKARDNVQELNRNLELAQEKISKLTESASDALYDVERWSIDTAWEVAQTIEAAAVEVWIYDDHRLRELLGAGLSAPDANDLRTISTSHKPLIRESDTLYPVLGLSRRLFGVLGVPSVVLVQNEVASRLVGNFALQLGCAMELRQTRDELLAAEKQRRQLRSEMVGRGEGVLQVCLKCRRCYDQNADRCVVDGSMLEMPPPFPYRVNGRYRLRKILGEGGMGIVYAAFDERLERDVAIKVVKSELFHHERIRRRFEREARSAARIEHPGIIAIFDSGELFDGSQFIVMEMLEGRSLGRLIKNFGAGTPRQVAKMLRLAGSALTAAHLGGFVHRDITPSNIFITGGLPDFEVKIVDFGIAQEVGAEPDLTQTGSILGTPSFMSPEQIHRRPLDARSDLYSFGAVSYLALTGRRVTKKSEMIDLVLEVCNVDPPPISELLPNTPPEVDRAFAQILSKDPNGRPESAEGWVSSFVDVLEEMPGIVSGWERRPSWLRPK